MTHIIDSSRNVRAAKESSVSKLAPPSPNVNGVSVNGIFHLVSEVPDKEKEMLRRMQKVETSVSLVVEHCERSSLDNTITDDNIRTLDSRNADDLPTLDDLNIRFRDDDTALGVCA